MCDSNGDAYHRDAGADALFAADAAIPATEQTGRKPRSDTRQAPAPHTGSTPALDAAAREAAHLRLEEAARLTRIGGFSVDPATSRVTVDPMVCMIFDAPADFSPSIETLLRLIRPAGRPVISDALTACLEQGRAFDVEARAVGWSGSDLYVRIMGRAILDGGHCVRVAGAIQDVTTQRERDAAIERLQARFRSIVENTPAIISLRDRSGVLHLANSRYEAMVGRDNLSGLFEEDLFPETVADMLHDRDATAFSADTPVTTEDVYEAETVSRTLLTSRFRIHDPVIDDDVVCAIGADITDLKRLQSELEAARRVAEGATLAKDNFVSVISHELRTPMNGVLGMVEAMTGTALDADQRRMLGIIRDSGRLMMALVNDLLDAAKVERGALVLEQRPFDPVSAVETALAGHHGRAAAKGVHLRFDKEDGASHPRLGDAIRIQQIVHNLVGNAIKFTEQGSVRVAVGASADGALLLSVADDGIGMTPEETAHAFERFAQANASISRRFGGTGLGLSIVKGLTEAMGGSVRVESAPGAGSRFSVTLPLSYAATTVGANTAEQTEAQPLAGCRVLAADDNEINRTVLAAFLDQLGAQADMATDGQQAVEMARTGIYDVLLLDVVMPELDGPAALRAIGAEAKAAGRSPPPAVAVTGQAAAEEIDACREAGFLAHLAKPVDQARLAETLIQIMSGRRATPSAADALP